MFLFPSRLTDRLNLHGAVSLKLPTLFDQQGGGLDIRFYPGAGCDLDSLGPNGASDDSRNKKPANANLSLDGAALTDNQIPL